LKDSSCIFNQYVCDLQKLYRNGIKLKKDRLASDTVQGELSTFAMGGGPNIGRAVPMAQITEHGGSLQVLALLYKVVIGHAGADVVQLSGLERIETSQGICWVAQAWRCQITQPFGAPHSVGGSSFLEKVNQT
jgi:hypothetical protein